MTDCLLRASDRFNAKLDRVFRIRRMTDYGGVDVIFAWKGLSRLLGALRFRRRFYDAVHANGLVEM